MERPWLSAEATRAIHEVQRTRMVLPVEEFLAWFEVSTFVIEDEEISITANPDDDTFELSVGPYERPLVHGHDIYEFQTPKELIATLYDWLIARSRGLDEDAKRILAPFKSGHRP
jgi:hypothetical protein